MNRAGLLIGLAAALALAAWLRLPALDFSIYDDAWREALPPRLRHLAERPFHGDEAVHAFRFDELWRSGRFTYDPNEHHGPTLYYFTLPVVWLGLADTFADSDEADYRLVTVAFGLATVLLCALFVRGFGVWPSVTAALLIAASVPLVYYSRYYIHETLLGFFVVAAIGCGWRYAWSLQRGWLIAAGVCAGFALATKETAVIAALAALPALRRRADQRAIGLAAGVALFTAVVLLSDFGRNPRGPVDFVLSFRYWLPRAGATELHQQPPWYYLELMAYVHRSGRSPVCSEGLILGLGLLGLLGGLLAKPGDDREPHPALHRFLAIYTLATIVIYSLIPYKTPWMVINLVLPLALLAGAGTLQILRGLKWRPLQAVGIAALLAGVWQLSGQAVKLNGDYATHGGNPYAYAHPVPDVIDLGARVEAVARVSPAGLAEPVYVLTADDYHWPIPWYLRRLDRVGYFVGEVPTPPASIVVADSTLDEALRPLLEATHDDVGLFGLRPRSFFVLWVERGLWADYLESRSAATGG